MNLFERVEKVIWALGLAMALLSSAAIAQNSSSTTESQTNTPEAMMLKTGPLIPPEVVEEGDWLEELTLERPPVILETIPEPVIVEYEEPVIVVSTYGPSVGDMFSDLLQVAFFAIPGFILFLTGTFFFLIMKHAVQRHYTQRPKRERSLARYSELLSLADSIHFASHNNLEFPRNLQDRFLILVAELELVGDESVSSASRGMANILFKRRELDCSDLNLTSNDETEDFESLRNHLLNALRETKVVKKQTLRGL
ncbi:MAG: hypothetical protein L3J36_07140 [Rhodobacteraceae bacterium]|nr:hypothetical protein [Paracoccaceae bacterium]